MKVRNGLIARSHKEIFQDRQLKMKVLQGCPAQELCGVKGNTYKPPKASLFKAAS